MALARRNGTRSTNALCNVTDRRNTTEIVPNKWKMSQLIDWFERGTNYIPLTFLLGYLSSLPYIPVSDSQYRLLRRWRRSALVGTVQLDLMA